MIITLGSKGNQKHRATLPLPHELIVEILWHVTNQYDKNSARLVCKDFAAAGLPSLTNGIVRMSHFRCDYERLIEISNTDMLNKNIHTLICYTPVLDVRYATGESSWDDWWSKSIKEDPVLHRHTFAGPKKRSQRTFDRYVKLCDQQISYNDDLQSDFTNALVKMPNIRHITIVDDHLSSNRFMPQKEISTFGMNAAWNVWDLSETPYPMFVFVVRAASHARLKLSKFHIRHHDGPFFTKRTAIDNGLSGISHQLTSDADDLDIEHLQCLFKDCKDLHLVIDPLGNETKCTNSIHLPKGLPKLLGCMSAVRKLEINVWSWTLVHINIGRLFGEMPCAWPHLTTLELAFVIIDDPENLALFLQSHTKTLELVHLHAIQLRGSSWQDFLVSLSKKEVKVKKEFVLVLSHSMNNDKPKLEVIGIEKYLSSRGVISGSMKTEEVDSDAEVYKDHWLDWPRNVNEGITLNRKVVVRESEALQRRTRRQERTKRWMRAPLMLFKSSNGH